MRPCVDTLRISVLLICICASSSPLLAANFALRVVDYAPGTSPAGSLTNPESSLGSPARTTAEGTQFASVVSPFSPPFLSGEIVSIGSGGWLTLQLERFAIPQPATREIGVFGNVGIIDTQFPNGVAGNPVGAFGIDDAMVEVSEDGISWISLGAHTFDVPTNGFADLGDPFSSSPGLVETDFGQPFIGGLADFADLAYAPDMLTLLGGGGGGTWLDISATGLDRVGYVRFLVSGLTPGANFELDAVSVASSATGAIVPEPSTFTLALLSLLMLRRQRRCQ